MSAVLLCVYTRDVLRLVAGAADATLYDFLDDVNAVSKPAEARKVLAALHRLLPSVSFMGNT